MARRQRKAPIKVTIRLYPGQHDALIVWYEALGDEPYGRKAQQLRAALQRGMENKETPAPDAVHYDLAEIRRVVEAAVDTALARFVGSIGTAARRPAAEEDETEALLDNLGGALLLPE